MTDLSDKDLLIAIYNKLEILENKVNNYEKIIKENKNFTAFSVDTLDSLADRNQEKIDKILLLINKLLKDELLDSVIILLDKFENISSLIKNNSNLIEFALDTIDSIAKRSEENGLELSALLENLFVLLNKLSSKDTIKLLNNLLDRSSILNEYLINIDNIPNAISTAIDTFDKYAEKINNSTQLSEIKDKFNEISKEEEISIIKILKMLNDKNIKKQMYLFLSLIKSIDYSFKGE